MTGDSDPSSPDASSTETPKREVAALYSRVSATYDAIGPAVFARFGEQVVALAGIHPGASVLDVAAGRGANLLPAAAAAGPHGRVVGIDIAEDMVEHTARAIRDRGLTNATVLHMDAEDLIFAAASFDVILCRFAYFFFPNPERALAACFRVLRPGGRLLLTAHGGTDQRWRWYDRRSQDSSSIRVDPCRSVRGGEAGDEGAR